jgi:hypothetical protein
MTVNDSMAFWAFKEGHMASDTDISGTTNYYGFLKPDGYWYIMKEVVSGAVTTFRYSKGTASYTTNWTNRAALTYGYANVTFA